MKQVLSASITLLVALLLLSADRDAGAAAGGHASIQLPADYAAGDFPVGRKTFRVQTDLPPEALAGIRWTLDGVRQAAQVEELTVSFEQPDTHVLEACVTTRTANHCDRRRLGPPPQRVEARNRLISATVVRKDGPDEPVTGLGPSDFRLTYRGKELAGRVLSVQQDAAGSGPGICMAYLFDVSGSMMGMDAKSGRGHVLARNAAGSYQLTEELRARFQAFAGVGSIDPDRDLILGGAFAGGLLTIGPIQGSRAASLPSLLEKLIVREYLRDPRPEAPLWSHTSLYENVALVGLVLAHEPACSGKKKVIVLDSDLVQFPEKAAVDLNDTTLDMIARSLEGHDSERLLDDLASEEIAPMPVFALDRTMRSFTPNEQKKRQAFIREVVQRSGGEARGFVPGTPAETRERLDVFFRRVRAMALAEYDLFWDPDGIENPDQVMLSLANPDLKALARAARRPLNSGDLPRRILADRAGRYNNAQKLAAAMFARKATEEGTGTALQRSTLTASLEAERRLSPPSAPLVRELEKTLLAMLLEQVKYSGEPEAVRRGIQALAMLHETPAEQIDRMADFIPPAHRDDLCKDHAGTGSALETLRTRLCAK
jgi:hypothetical protein